MLHAPNSRDYLTVVFAAWRVGAVITPTNCKLTPTEAARARSGRHARPCWCWMRAPTPTPRGLAPVADVDHLRRSRDDDAVPHDRSADRRRTSALVSEDATVMAGDPAWFFFTSGSSGRPKSAVLTHDHLAFIVNNHIADLMPGLVQPGRGPRPGPVVARRRQCTCSHTSPAARAIVLLPGDSFDATEAWSLIGRHRVSTMFTVPTILNRLVAAVAADTDRSSLRQVIYAGAPITKQDQRRAFEVLGPVIEQYYGLAEVTGAITVLPPGGARRTPATYEGIVTAGYPRTGMTISIQDCDGNPVPTGARGEICVVGPAVFAGYLENDEANARAFRDGWFRTGDLGVLDERGLLYITGRASDMYISGGSNIDPREVEEKILAHPRVRAVGVVGAPDPDWGEVGYAVAVVEDGSAQTSCSTWCRDHMARYKAPKVVHLVDQLPTTAYGKVTTPVLRELLQAEGRWPEATGPVNSLGAPTASSARQRD